MSRRTPGVMLTTVRVLAVVVAAVLTSVTASSLTASESPPPLHGASAVEHQWLVAPRAGDTWVLLHRMAEDPPETYDSILPLPQPPEAMAAASRSVVLCFAPPADAPKGRHTVFSVTVDRHPVHGGWFPVGRPTMQDLPSLPGGANVLSLAVDGSRALALVHEPDVGLRLMQLDEWRWVPAGPAVWPQTTGGRGDVAIDSESNVGILLETPVAESLDERESGTTDPAEADSLYAFGALAEDGAVTWRSIGVYGRGARLHPMDDGFLVVVPASNDQPGRLVTGLGGTATVDDPLTTQAGSLDASSVFLGRTLESAVIVRGDDLDSLTAQAVIADASTAAGEPSASPMRLRPVDTGALVRGPLVHGAGIFIVAVMIALLARRPSDAAPVKSASSGRRFFASVIDGAVAAFVSVVILRIDPQAVMRGIALTGDLRPWFTFVLVWTAIPLVSEIATGRSFGKLLCRLQIRSENEPDRLPPLSLGLLRVLVRSVGLLVPPIGLVVFLHPARRGLHDLAAHSIVVDSPRA